MHKQRGVSMWIFFTWSVIGVLIAWLSYQLVPAYTEYRSIMHTIRTITQDSQASKSPEFSNISAIRERFTKQANIDYISSLKAEDLKIGTEGGRVIISFQYEKRVKLVGDLYLVMDFRGDSRT